MNKRDISSIVIIILVIIAIIALVAFLYVRITGNPITQFEKSCTDSDGGKNRYERGIVVNEKGVSYEDVCAQTELKEYFCNTRNLINSIIIHCENGCLGGVCSRD